MFASQLVLGPGTGMFVVSLGVEEALSDVGDVILAVFVIGSSYRRKMFVIEMSLIL